MDRELMIITSLIVLTVFIILIMLWRFFSTRQSLPCPTWLAWMVEMDNPFAKVAHAKTIVKNLDLKPAMQVVDIGCGPGRVTFPLAHHVGQMGRVTAMDIQQGMLDKLKAKARELRQDNIIYLCAGIGEGKLEKSKFDRAVLVTVLGEIPQQEKALAEIYACLKPGGILSVTEIIFDPHFQRRGKVKKLAESAGFHEKERFGNTIAYTLNFIK